MEYEFGKIAKLDESLRKHGVDAKLRAAIMKGGASVKASSANAAKSKWFLEAMERMDAVLAPGLKFRVREDCACCLSGKRREICRRIFKENDSLEKRLEAADRAKYVFGNGVKRSGPRSFEVSFFDPSRSDNRCVCLKDAPGEISVTYCYCCGGHVKRHLETALGLRLEVKVISSLLSSEGKKNCRFLLAEADTPA